jgi:cytoskeletal protein CcmA (bactofilin family)
LSNQRKQQPEKISADCPHCGFSQLESAYAKSTICRQCSQPYSIEKLLAKEVSSLKAPSIFDKLSKLVSRETTREISCFSCHATQQVSSSAESSLCPKCGSYIDLRDFKITGPFGRSIQTQGEVIITNKGDASSQRILCGSALIEGKMRGQLLCTNTVSVKIQGKLQGSIESERLVVEKKAETEFTRPLRARSVEINGKASGQILCDGKVTINKNGDLSGVVYARSIVVEKGGIFSGELHIGEDLEKSATTAEEPSPPATEPPPASPAAEPEAPGAVPPVSPPKTGHLPGFEPKKAPETPGRFQRPGTGTKGKPTRKIR